MKFSASPVNDEIARKLSRDAVVVIPCYNTGDRVEQVTAAVREYVERVIVVDDGSTDGCAANLDDVAQVIRFTRNRGKGHALIAGIKEALSLPDAGVIILMDADGQHDPHELPGLFSAFEREQPDLLIGARRFDGRLVPWPSRFGNRVTAWLTTRVFGRRLPDTQSGLRLLAPGFAHVFVEQTPGGRYETEMRMLLLALRGNFKLAFAPITTIYEAGNTASHFRKIRDSIRVYLALIQDLFRKSRNTSRQA